MFRLVYFLLVFAAQAVAQSSSAVRAPDGSLATDAEFDLDLFDYFDFNAVALTMGAIVGAYVLVAVFTHAVSGAVLGSFFGPLGALLGVLKGAFSGTENGLKALVALIGALLQRVMWFFLLAAFVCSLLAYVFGYILPNGVALVLNFGLGDYTENDMVARFLAWTSYIWWMVRGQEVLSVWLTAIGWKWIANAVSVVILKQSAGEILR